MNKKRALTQAVPVKGLSFSLELYNVARFGALGRVDNVELDLLAFSQRLKAAVLYVAEMDEHIAAIFAGNEAKSFGVIEPLYRTCFHDKLPPSEEIEATDKDKKNAAKSNCLCGFPTRTSETSNTHTAPSGPECQALLLRSFRPFTNVAFTRRETIKYQPQIAKPTTARASSPQSLEPTEEAAAGIVPA
jgi:hypothetical protein